MGKYLDKKGVDKLWNRTKGYIENKLSKEPDTNGYEFVDMGEAGIWATCNIGANNPEETGLYFQWGDTKGYIKGCTEAESDTLEDKHYFNWSKYKFGTRDNITKYNSADGLKTLELEDDAAHVNMGGDWRMPTDIEFKKLYDLCDTEIISTGNKGVKFTLKTDSSKVLFFPLTGFGSSNIIYYTDNYINLWFSTLNDSSITSGNVFLAQLKNSIVTPDSYADRSRGNCIRAILNTSNSPDYLTKQEAKETYQEKGDYATKEELANKSDVYISKTTYNAIINSNASYDDVIELVEAAHANHVIKMFINQGSPLLELVSTQFPVYSDNQIVFIFSGLQHDNMYQATVVINPSTKSYIISSAASRAFQQSFELENNLEFITKPNYGIPILSIKEWKGTQAEYDALGEYDDNTKYYIYKD